ncbi:MAG: GntR family transcriptional regulator [Burkholderiaceae bacterium]|nr:GntR family transcriptional regulator [Burkholderiaceae bacterium]
MNSRTTRFSHRSNDLKPSPVREILAVIDRPGMISFAGGLPAAESFVSMDLGTVPQEMLQYGASEGEKALRNKIAASVNELGLQCSPEQVLILSGSQQGIDLMAKLFIDPGTTIAVENPTYLAALQVFRFFGASYQPLDRTQTDFGLNQSQTPPAFAYVIPSFQNPTGYCYTAQERIALAEACDRHNVVLFEDDPYRDLVFDPCERTPVCAHVKRASWVYQGSFSKILAPGLRLGYLVASPDLVPYLTRLKQAADLHSSRVSQWAVLNFLNDPGYADRLKNVAELYRRKRDDFAAALKRHFSGLAQWQMPAGGLFFWLTLNNSIDTEKLLPTAIERGVAFVPGKPFYANEAESHGTLRLNFSHASREQMDTGLSILASMLK